MPGVYKLGIRESEAELKELLRAEKTGAEKALEKKLQCSEGMNSYGEICQWLKEELGIEVKYKTVKLKVPSNIMLMFQPPYCPESNPIEQVWQYLKKREFDGRGIARTKREQGF